MRPTHPRRRRRQNAPPPPSSVKLRTQSPRVQHPITSHFLGTSQFSCRPLCCDSVQLVSRLGSERVFHRDPTLFHPTAPFPSTGGVGALPPETELGDRWAKRTRQKGPLCQGPGPDLGRLTAAPSRLSGAPALGAQLPRQGTSPASTRPVTQPRWRHTSDCPRTRHGPGTGAPAQLQPGCRRVSGARRTALHWTCPAVWQ